MIHSRKVTALVPMKAHSERIKEKNLREFCGKPLFHHVMAALDRTYAVDEIIVNTDSDAIAVQAKKLFRKVKIHERPKDLCGDMVSMNRIIEYDLLQADGDLFLQTHATNPLIKPETFAAALKAFAEDEEGHDSLFGVNAYQSRFYTADGKPINHDPAQLIRTQDLAPVYEENSCLYIFTRESFAAAKARIGLKPMFYPTPRIESVDIDDEVSWRIAELLGLHALLAVSRT